MHCVCLISALVVSADRNSWHLLDSCVLHGHIERSLVDASNTASLCRNETVHMQNVFCRFITGIQSVYKRWHILTSKRYPAFDIQHTFLLWFKSIKHQQPHSQNSIFMDQYRYGPMLLRNQQPPPVQLRLVHCINVWICVHSHPEIKELLSVAIFYQYLSYCWILTQKRCWGVRTLNYLHQSQDQSSHY